MQNIAVKVAVAINLVSAAGLIGAIAFIIYHAAQ